MPGAPSPRLGAAQNGGDPRLGLTSTGRGENGGAALRGCNGGGGGGAAAQGKRREGKGGGVLPSEPHRTRRTRRDPLDTTLAESLRAGGGRGRAERGAEPRAERRMTADIGGISAAALHLGSLRREGGAEGREEGGGRSRAEAAPSPPVAAGRGRCGGRGGSGEGPGALRDGGGGGWSRVGAAPLARRARPAPSLRPREMAPHGLPPPALI